jgi:hypothetical protein
MKRYAGPFERPALVEGMPGTPGAIQTTYDAKGNVVGREKFVPLDIMKQTPVDPADDPYRGRMAFLIERALETNTPIRPLPPQNGEGQFVLLSLEP